MSICTHARTTRDDYHAFSGGVAATADDENRASHGCVTCTEICSACGASRRVNVNQLHEEYGAWYTLADAHRDEKARRERARYEVLRSAGVESVVWSDDRDTLYVRFSRGNLSDLRCVSYREALAASRQPDNGDGLVQFYAALLA